jgi:hypothetical protein
MTSLFGRILPAASAAVLVSGLACRCAGQAPGMPASPLAGGMAAAQSGQAFMDAHGNPIIIPAHFAEPRYMEGCPPGYGGNGGYGAPVYADFGGYSMPDQCGPHYFDIAVAGVAIRGERLFDDVLPFADDGVGISPTQPEVPLLDPQNDYQDVEPGWQISARYDIGPLSVLEATYMGIYDLGFFDRVTDPTTAQITTVFSQYGQSNIDPPLAGLEEDVDSASLEYDADLQSTEFSYRRYWVGYNPRISGTYLAGFRYVRMSEQLFFDTTSASGDASFTWESENDLVGAQLGGDGWISLRQGLRLGAEGKAGVYNNRFGLRHTVDIPESNYTDRALTIDNDDFTINDEDDHAAFVGEVSVDLVADILPSVSLRVGYRALYLSSLATVGNNVFPNEIVDAINTDAVPDRVVLSQAGVVYHGLNGGIEYIW